MVCGSCATVMLTIGETKCKVRRNSLQYSFNFPALKVSSQGPGGVTWFVDPQLRQVPTPSEALKANLRQVRSWQTEL